MTNTQLKKIEKDLNLITAKIKKQTPKVNMDSSSEDWREYENLQRVVGNIKNALHYLTFDQENNSDYHN